MSQQWTWLPSNPTGGTGGGAYSKLFRNDVLPTPDLLAREVLQNSWDAALSHRARSAAPFSFRFRFARFSGSEKKQFIKAANLDALKQRRSQLEDSRDWPSVEAVQRLIDPGEDLEVLYLEDYGTHGMFGDPARITGSHLYKALYVLGSTSKDNEATSQGGSFGFGKSAFIGSSSVRTAIAHTRFEASPDDIATQRLIGFTWWGEHEINSQPYEGRAMFGIVADEERLGAHPLINDEAERVAQELGMPPRGDSERLRGSTVLLLSPEVGPEEVKDAVERYWWPALEDQLIDVSIETSEGEELRPRPRLNAKLRPFLQAYGIATGTKTPRNAQEERIASTKWRSDAQGTKFGTLALVIDREYTPTHDDDVLGLGDMTTPTVALIRGPRMVIEYRSFSSRLPIRGVYLADPSIDSLLREVEPPAHNTWDNLGSHDISERSREVARGVLSRIRRSVKEFAAEFSPPPTAVLTDLPLFGDLLSRVMSGRVPGPPVPPGQNENPKPALYFKLSKPDRRETVEGGRLVIERYIGIKIPQEVGWSRGHLFGTFHAAIAQDLSASASGALGLQIQVPDGFELDDSLLSFSGEVAAGEEYVFSVRTDPFDRNLSVLVTPRVQVASSAANKVGS